MIHCLNKINAVLNLRNFEFAFKGAFCKTSPHDYILSEKTLYENLFHSLYNLKSETECELMIDDDFNIRYLIDELRNVSNQLIVKKSGEFFINYECYPKWKKVSLEHGQDVFLCSLDSKPLCDWPFTLTTNSNLLDLGLEDGYAENHCHFSAAGPAFLINWLLIHNFSSISNPLGTLNSHKNEFLKYYSNRQYNQFRNVTILSIYLRRYLYNLCRNGGKNSSLTFSRAYSLADLENKKCKFEYELSRRIQLLTVPTSMNVTLKDYACPKNCKEPLFGERFLLQNCFRNYNKFEIKDKMRVFLYLLCRQYMISFFHQNNLWYGFHNFKRFERLGDLFVFNNAKLKNEISKKIYTMLYQNKGMKKLEVRTAPKQNFSGTISRLNSYNPFNLFSKRRINKDIPCDLQHGIVLHFIKETRKRKISYNIKRPTCEPRSIDKILEFEKQTTSIIACIRRYKDKNFPLVGVDAANEEIRFRPEIFAPFYRKVRKAVCETTGLDHFGFTYHVGEDFNTLCDGLRAVYEAVNYLDLADGDRLGHASALGTDVKRYFTIKGKMINQTKQDALDDACFLFSQVRNLENQKIINNLRDFSKNLLLEIYGHDSFDSYLRSLALRGDHPYAYRQKGIAGRFKERYQEQRNKGLTSYLNNTNDSNYQNAWMDQEALDYIYEYHYSKSARKAGDELICRVINDEYITALQIAQEQVARFLIAKNVCVETNPTSNYLIGPFEEFEEIPTLSMLGIKEGKEYYKDLRISIGTDDPGLFSTNLRNEYASIMYTLREMKIVEGTSLINFMSHLAKMSLDSSFIKGA